VVPVSTLDELAAGVVVSEKYRRTAEEEAAGTLFATNVTVTVSWLFTVSTPTASKRALTVITAAVEESEPAPPCND